MKDAITLDTKLQRNDANFLASALGEETVMMNLETGDYLGINSVGSDIWNQLQTPKTIKDILAYLTSVYEVDANQCQQETMSYLHELVNQNVLSIV